MVYTSEYTGDPENIEQDLQAIVSSARRNNASIHVTGTIFYQNRRFLEFIEGDREVLRKLMSRIGKDSRHKNIEFLFDDPIDERGFRDWGLQSFNLATTDPLPVEALQYIRDAFRRNFTTSTSLLVSVMKDFVEQAVGGEISVLTFGV